MADAAPLASGSDGDTGIVVVYVTVPSMEVGEAIAGHVVEQQLAACVNILPGVTSIYSWEGKINKDAELLLIIKTRAALLSALTAAVKGRHPYQECEVIALPVVGGSPSYIKWVLDNSQAAAKSQ